VNFGTPIGIIQTCLLVIGDRASAKQASIGHRQTGHRALLVIKRLLTNQAETTKVINPLPHSPIPPFPHSLFPIPQLDDSSHSGFGNSSELSRTKIGIKLYFFSFLGRFRYNNRSISLVIFSIGWPVHLAKNIVVYLPVLPARNLNVV